MIDTTLLIGLIIVFVITYGITQRYTATSKTLYNTGSKGYEIFGAVFILVTFLYFATSGTAILNLVAMLMVIAGAFWFAFEFKPKRL